ncbi:MAG: phosphoenolpyruvate carboxykinase [Thalassobaculum sp.]
MGNSATTRTDLTSHGLSNLGTQYWDLDPALLTEHAIRRGEARLSAHGAVVVSTGEHTGRSPKDRFIVRDGATESTVDWGSINQPIDRSVFDAMHARVQAYYHGRDAFVLNCYAGADPDYRLKVRVVTETAWQNLFARNMFIRPPAADLPGFEPDFTILHAPGLTARGAEDGVRSSTFILVDFDRRMILIGGSSYAGEIKKSIFGVLNYLLPDRGVMPMHCSANIGPKGDSAIFFGLSGTGKTTLSADGSRTLIGDDEHGWSENGIFNFEGGCYAKVIKLSQEAEPEIWAASHRFGTVLENVVMDPVTRMLNLDSAEFTENTRACYPIDFIPNTSADGMAGHPVNVVMLTADAFGVLPPISKLSPEQAMYHFLSGYTARVAGTEKGVTEPQATFSTCFGAPFMPRHPSVYGEMLRERIARHGATCWLVNTGWSGGRAGAGGERMKIAYTRAMVRAALDGTLGAAPVQEDGQFGLLVPEACPNVPSEVLRPRGAWSDGAAYDVTAGELRGRFEENFKPFEAFVDDSVKAAGVRRAA